MKEYDTYADVVDAYVAARRAESDAVERTPAFYASDFGTCHRRMILKRAGAEGRPMTIDQMRNLEERASMHDHRVQQLAARPDRALIAADTGSAYVKAKVPTRLSDGMPEGFGCRADGIGHVRCHCGCQPFPLSVHWGKMARLHRTDKAEQAEFSRRQLARHKLDLIEIKTAHPNLMRYSESLPKPHNVLQVRTGAWACRRLYGLNLTPVLIYFAVGSGQRPLEFICGEPEDTYEDVEREVSTLQQEWFLWETEKMLPDPKPLMTTTRKEKAERVVFRVADWQCDELYCEYANTPLCAPNVPVVPSGDRLGYLEPDGSVTYVSKWLDKLPGFAMVGITQVIDKPRTSAKES